jgi:hypothetical protein
LSYASGYGKTSNESRRLGDESYGDSIAIGIHLDRNIFEESGGKETVDGFRYIFGAQRIASFQNLHALQIIGVQNFCGSVLDTSDNAAGKLRGLRNAIHHQGSPGDDTESDLDP